MTSFALLNDLLIASDGRIYSQDRELTQFPHVRGKYRAVNHGRRTHYVHRLVAQAHAVPAEGEVVRHWDDNGWNNDASNLVWGTYQDNADDAMRNGRAVAGESHPHANLTDSTVYRARVMKANGTHIDEITAFLGVSKWTVYDALNGRTWKHVPMPEGFDPSRRTDR